MLTLHKLHGWKAIVLALVAGALLPFAFAPFEFRILALFSPAILFLLLQGEPVKRAGLLGWVFGLGYFGIGVSWVYNSIHLFGDAVAPLAAFVTVLFVLVMTLFTVSMTALYAKLSPRQPLLVQALIFASVWVLLELLRGWVLGGFPWILLGYSQVDTLYGAFAPVTGVYGISWLVAFSAALLGCLLMQSDKVWRLSIVGLLLIIVGSGFVLEGIEWAKNQAKPVKIRMVQGNVKQEMKFSRATIINSLELYADLSLRDLDSETKIIIWPETAIATYFGRAETFLADFLTEIDQRGADLLSGGFNVDEDNRPYNAFKQLGGEQQLYRKHHLVMFGEYIPLRSVVGWISQFIEIPMSDLAAGTNRPKPMKIQGQFLGVSICFEDAFGEEMRHLLPQSTLLINVSNDAWFGETAAPYQHQEIAAMRAKEFSRPLIRVTNTGISSSISARGEVLESIPQYEEGVLDIEVYPRDGMTPYVWLGNYPVIVLMLLVLLYAASRQVFNHKSD